MLPTGRPCAWGGPYNWTVQTFIQLRSRGFPCELTARWPEEGIILAHSDFLEARSKPSRRSFIVELKPDRHLCSAYANFVIAQNRHDRILVGQRAFAIKGLAIPVWPQPDLVPRDAGRGHRFENACFMGNLYEFIEDVKSLEQALCELDLAWKTPPIHMWHDYSEVDVIIAVRRNSSSMVDRKPPSRLTNAWLAGVPAVLSPDSAFEDIRRSELDFLRARDVGEVIEALKLLIGNPRMRADMVQNGLERSGEFSAERITDLWVHAIESHIMPEYVRWRRSQLGRALFFCVRQFGGIDGPTMPRRLAARAKGVVRQSIGRSLRVSRSGKR
jgi:hypothetical protein